MFKRKLLKTHILYFEKIFNMLISVMLMFYLNAEKVLQNQVEINNADVLLSLQRILRYQGQSFVKAESHSLSCCCRTAKQRKTIELVVCIYVNGNVVQLYREQFYINMNKTLLSTILNLKMIFMKIAEHQLELLLLSKNFQTL